MNKSLISIISLTAVLSLTSCGDNTSDNSVTTEQPPQSEIATEQVVSTVNKDVFNVPVETNELLGLWESEELSVSIQFNDDGTYTNDSVEGTYSCEDNKLTLVYAGGQVVEDYSMGIHDGQLVLVRDDFQIILDKAE